MLKLVGKKETKPFECVGTKKETFLAFSLALKRAKKRKKVPFLLKKFEELHIKTLKSNENSSRSVSI